MTEESFRAPMVRRSPMQTKVTLTRSYQHRDRGGISTTSLIVCILRPEAVKEDPSTPHALRALHDEFAASCSPPIPVIEPGAAGSLSSWEWPYLSGSWDCISTGHSRLLEDAKTITQKKGGRLLVAVSDDKVYLMLLIYQCTSYIC